jgi:hypothetical protein
LLQVTCSSVTSTPESWSAPALYGLETFLAPV